MPERATVFDCRLSTVRAPMPLQVRAAILAVRQLSGLVFLSAKPASAASSLEGGNRCIPKNNLCRLISHMAASLQKYFLAVDGHQPALFQLTCLESFGLTAPTPS